MTVTDSEAAPVPATLIAVTVTVWSAPLVRPVIVQLVPVVVQDFPPGLAVAV